MYVVKLKLLVILCFLIFVPFKTYSQEQRIADSLLDIYYNSEYDNNSILELLYTISFNSSNPDTAIKYSRVLISTAQTSSDYYNIYRGFYLSGYALMQKGMQDEALKSFFQSAKFAEKGHNKRGLGIAYSSIAGSYSSVKNYSNSIQYYKKAICILTELKDTSSLASVFLNLGSNYVNFQKYDSAKFFYIKAENLFGAIGYKVGYAYSIGNIGLAQTKLGEYRDARNNLFAAINILEENNDYYSLSAYYSCLAEVFNNLNLNKEAIIYANKSLQISTNYGLLAQMRDACKRLSDIYYTIQNYSNAFKYQSLYYAYRDSIINEETIRKMADLRTEYEVSQKQSEIDALIKEKKIQRTIGISLAAILMLTAGLIVILSIHSKHNRKFSEKLAEQKEELQRQHDQLEELNKTKDRFFSIISHDLRGPIGVLNGTTLLIREYLESKDYKQLSDLTANMEYSVKKVQHLLDNLLEWAISQQGKFNYNPERVEINEVINEVLGIFEGMAFSKNISVKYVCKYDKLYLITDRNSLLTIIRNLVSNALKFTQRNGVITIMVYKTDKTVTIKISDTGVGIPQKKIKTLFKIDENKSTWGTEREKGLGIGLSLVNEFVTMNHGTVEVESEEGVGTTFTIKFPSESVQKQILVPQDI